MPDSDRWYLWDTVAKALDVRQSRPVAGPPLVRLFRDPRLPLAHKWTVGCALYRVADVSVKLNATRAVDRIARHLDSPVPNAKQAARSAVAKLGAHHAGR